MSEATDAIKDLQEALAEYGSDVTLRVVTPGVYDPMTGVTYTNVDTPLKAIIKSEATVRITEAFNFKSKLEGTISSYELSLMFYSAIKPRPKIDKIVVDSEVYNILYVSATKIQNVVIKYELLVSK